ncbi:cysteine--tRNA ligase, partial [Candidatus Saccharibacteria bacterium]|nr:cysteine--tRNA ligase [Candidatus Saccharibacteria bacterium]
YNTDNILDALQNDINSPEALRKINAKFDILIDKLLPSADMDHFEKMLVAIDNLLGLKLSKIKDISEDQKQLISQREQARKAKNWHKSDELRQLLKNQGIELRDSPVGPIWSPSQQ